MRHRAKHRYKYGKYRGKTIPRAEAERRIAQSYGFKFTLPEDKPVTTPGVGTSMKDQKEDTIIVA